MLQYINLDRRASLLYIIAKRPKVSFYIKHFMCTSSRSFFLPEKVLLTLNHIVKPEVTENCDIWKEESKNELEKNEIEEHEYNTTYKLNSYGIDFDVNGLVRRQNSHSIYLPDFQRNYVWSKKKASKFIESLLLGLPIPSVCLYKEEDNKQIIIDGFQRLESIRLFYSKKFSDGSKFALVSVNSSFEMMGGLKH